MPSSCFSDIGWRIRSLLYYSKFQMKAKELQKACPSHPTQGGSCITSWRAVGFCPKTASSFHGAVQQPFLLWFLISYWWYFGRRFRRRGVKIGDDIITGSFLALLLFFMKGRIAGWPIFIMAFQICQILMEEIQINFFIKFTNIW